MSAIAMLRHLTRKNCGEVRSTLETGSLLVCSLAAPMRGRVAVHVDMQQGRHWWATDCQAPRVLNMAVASENDATWVARHISRQKFSPPCKKFR